MHLSVNYCNPQLSLFSSTVYKVVIVQYCQFKYCISCEIAALFSGETLLTTTYYQL